MAVARYFLNGAALVLGYVVAGKLALLLALPPGYASAIFPPAGIAVVAAYVGGRRYLPWVFGGSWILNILVGANDVMSLTASAMGAATSIAAASTLQAAAGGWALRRFVGDSTAFDHVREVIAFLVIAPTVCIISASLSVSYLTITNVFEFSGFVVNWFKWWLGDTLGVTVMLPLLLILVGEPRALWRRRKWQVALPMVVALTLSIVAFVKVSKWEQEDALSGFRAKAQQISAQLQNRFQQHEFLVASVDGFLAHDTTQFVTRQEFRQFASSSAIPFPMVQAMEWAPQVAVGNRAEFELAQRREFPEFEIRERLPDGKLQRAGEREEYYPVTYVEPLESNKPALGFDLASTPERMLAVSRAMRSSGSVASAPITLVQESEKRSGILLMHRVSRGGNAPGLVLTVLRVDDFVEHALPADRSDFRLRLVDVAARKVIYGSADALPSPHAFEQMLTYGTRQYQLQIVPSDVYLAQHQGWQSLILHAAGLVGTSLLGAILLLGTGYTARVENLVEERTLELSRESYKNRLFLRNSSDGVHILDPFGKVIEASDSFCRMLGYPRSEVIGMNVARWDVLYAEGRSGFPSVDDGNSQVTFHTQYRVARMMSFLMSRFPCIRWNLTGRRCIPTRPEISANASVLRNKSGSWRISIP